MKTLVVLIGCVFSISAFAQDEAPSTDQDTQSDAESQQADDSGLNTLLGDSIVGAVSVPTLFIDVTLTNGIVVSGWSPQSEVLGWATGQALTFTPHGGDITQLDGGTIASIAQSTPPEPLRVVLAERVVEEQPVDDYASPEGFSFPNPATSRYLYAPSSIPLKKGQGYLSQKYGIFSSVAYAPDDNFTLLFGTLTFFPPAMTIFGGKSGWKVSDNVHVSVGGEIFVFPIDATIIASIGFGAVTFGNEDKHLTIATGAAGGDIVDGWGLPLMVAGQWRVSDGVAMVTENWALFDGNAISDNELSDLHVANIHSFAVRLVGRRDNSYGQSRGLRTSEGFPRTTWDLGLIMLMSGVDGGDVDFIGPLPWIDWTWHFGPSGG